MTRLRKKPHTVSDEKRKARNRARKADRAEGKPARQPLQRMPDARLDAGPRHIKGLQHTVGNRVVARLVAQAPGAPAVQREATIPASEEKDLVGAGTTKDTIPGVAGPAPMPFPNMSQPPGAASPPEVTSGSKMGGSMGDEPGTMKGLPSATTVSNDPGQSNAAVKPTAGIAPIQAPTQVEGESEQQSTTPPPQPEEQVAP